MKQQIWRRRRAASTAEYGLFVGLIAVLLLSVLSTTGQNLSRLFGYVANNIDGAHSSLVETEMVLMPNGVAVPSLPEQEENCAEGNMTEASVSILNAWSGKSWDASSWCLYTGINLSEGGLASPPPEIGLLTQLTNLNLTKNNIVTLPKEIGYLRNLTQLKLANNQLTSLPKEIGHLQALTRFDLEGNNLTVLPDAYAALSQLTSIRVQSNPSFRQFPEQLGQMTAVQSIIAAGDDLQSLPASIVDLPNLTDLSIYGGNPDLILTAEQCSFLQNLSGVFSAKESVCPYP